MQSSTKVYSSVLRLIELIRRSHQKLNILKNKGETYDMIPCDIFQTVMEQTNRWIHFINSESIIIQLKSWSQVEPLLKIIKEIAIRVGHMALYDNFTLGKHAVLVKFWVKQTGPAQHLEVNKKSVAQVLKFYMKVIQNEQLMKSIESISFDQYNTLTDQPKAESLMQFGNKSRQNEKLWVISDTSNYAYSLQKALSWTSFTPSSSSSSPQQSPISSVVFREGENKYLKLSLKISKFCDRNLNDDWLKHQDINNPEDVSLSMPTSPSSKEIHVKATKREKKNSLYRLCLRYHAFRNSLKN